MSSSISGEDLDGWLQQASRWQVQQPVVQSCVIQPKLEQLWAFLRKLEECLHTFDTVDDCMAALPTVGQLLGRLCALPSVLCYKATYMVLMRCVLWFIREQPSSPMEQRATDWALAQVRSTVCIQDEKLPQLGLRHSGYLQEEYNRAYNQELMKSIMKQIKPCGRMWSSDLDCFVPCTTERLPQSLPMLCEFCLSMLHSDSIAGLLSNMVEAVAVSGNAQATSHVMMKLYEYQQNQNKTGELPLRVTTVLWSHHLPSLEAAVLSLVQQGTQKDISPRQVESLVHKSKLPDVCVEKIPVHTAVLHMLHKLLVETDFETKLVRLAWLLSYRIFSLHECCTSPEACDWTTDVYPQPLQHLAFQLQMDMSALMTEIQEYQLQLTAPVLKEAMTGVVTQLATRGQLWFLLIQHWHWLHFALQLTLSGSKLVLPSCITTMEGFGYHCGREVCQVSFGKHVSSLRGLLGKINLQPTDITLSITASQDLSCNPCKHGQGALLMLFLVCASGASNVVSHVLEQVTDSQSPYVHLETWVTFMEEHLIATKKISRKLNLDSVNTAFNTLRLRTLGFVDQPEGKDVDMKNFGTLMQRTDRLLAFLFNS